jgi:uncharacterized protein (DUF4213/DUF364 family)
MITEELCEYLVAQHPQQRLSDVRIGLGYTAVELDDGGTGVAYTFKERTAGGCSVFMGRRPLAGRPVTEVLEYLESTDAVEATVGLAVANALTNRPAEDQSEGDILDLLPLRPEDRVGMVGFFGPLVRPLEKTVRELTIFERDLDRSTKARPAEAAFEELPGCDVAVITSTALIIGEMDRLLEAASTCREVALVGASTSLAAQVFASTPVTLLSGVVVVDAPSILQIVSEGGGMGFFGNHIRKVNVRLGV